MRRAEASVRQTLDQECHALMDWCAVEFVELMISIMCDIRPRIGIIDVLSAEIVSIEVDVGQSGGVEGYRTFRQVVSGPEKACVQNSCVLPNPRCLGLVLTTDEEATTVIATELAP